MTSDGVKLAALMYYSKTDSKEGFEALPLEKKKPWLHRAEEILLFLDQLNLELHPRGDTEKARVAHMKNLDILEGIIRNFVKGLNTTKPALFPYRELAHKILNFGRKV